MTSLSQSSSIENSLLPSEDFSDQLHQSITEAIKTIETTKSVHIIKHQLALLVQLLGYRPISFHQESPPIPNIEKGSNLEENQPTSNENPSQDPEVDHQNLTSKDTLSLLQLMLEKNENVNQLKYAFYQGKDQVLVLTLIFDIVFPNWVSLLSPYDQSHLIDPWIIKAAPDKVIACIVQSLRTINQKINPIQSQPTLSHLTSWHVSSPVHSLINEINLKEKESNLTLSSPSQIKKTIQSSMAIVHAQLIVNALTKFLGTGDDLSSKQYPRILVMDQIGLKKDPIPWIKMILDLVLDQSIHIDQKNNIWQNLITLLCTIPYLLANILHEKTPKFIQTQCYMTHITSGLLILITDDQKINWIELMDRFHFLSIWITKITNMNLIHSSLDLIRDIIVFEMEKDDKISIETSNSPSKIKATFLDKLNVIFKHLPSQVLDKVLNLFLNFNYPLPYENKQNEILNRVVGPWIDQSTTAQYLLSNKFLLIGHQFPTHVIYRIIDFLFKKYQFQFPIHINEDSTSNEHDRECQLASDLSKIILPFDPIQMILFLVTIFSSAQHIRTASFEQQLNLTRVLIYICKHYLTKEIIEGTDLLTNFMQSIQEHMNSPDFKIFNLGLNLGSVFCSIIDPSQPVEFEYEPIGLNEWETGSKHDQVDSISQDHLSPTTSILQSLEVDKEVKNGKKVTTEWDIGYRDHPGLDSINNSEKTLKLVHVQNESISQSPSSFDPDIDYFTHVEKGEESILEEYKMKKKDQNLKPRYGDDSPSIQSDQDDIFQPMMDEFKPYPNPISDQIKPCYLRDCITNLRTDEPDTIESTLKVLKISIDACPHELSDLAITLTSVLIHLFNKYELANFSTLRLDALVSLVNQETKVVVGYMTNEFYKSSYSLQERFDILEVLVQASSAMSSQSHPSSENKEEKKKRSILWDQNDVEKMENDYTKSHPSISSLPLLVQSKSNTSHSLELNYNKINTSSSKTRRWTRRMAPKNTRINRFGACAHWFILGLLEPLQHPRPGQFDLLRFDARLLGKLIYSMGVFLDKGKDTAEIIRISQQVVDFIFLVRYHQEAFVRRAVMLTIRSLINSIPAWVLFETMMAKTQEIYEWIFDLAQGSDLDPVVSNLAKVAINEWYQIIDKHPEYNTFGPLYASS